MRRSIGKKQQKTIARKRIQHLFNQAHQVALQRRLDLANRYVELARKLSMRYLITLPRKYKTRFCKHCNSYLLPGVNSRYRLGGHRIIIWCDECKKFSRRPFLREIKKKRKTKQKNMVPSES